MIFIVAIGEYEEIRNGLVTTNSEKAIDYILNDDNRDYDDKFSSLEVWVNEERHEIYDMFAYCRDKENGIDIKAEIMKILSK